MGLCKHSVGAADPVLSRELSACVSLWPCSLIFVSGPPSFPEEGCVHVCVHVCARACVHMRRGLHDFVYGLYSDSSH